MSWLIGVSILSLFFSLPFAVASFARLPAVASLAAHPQALGLTPASGGLLLGVALAIQGYGLVLAGRGRPGAAWLHVLVALGWIAADLLAEGRAIVPHASRAGLAGAGLAWALLAVMIALLLAARAALRTPRRRW